MQYWCDGSAIDSALTSIYSMIKLSIELEPPQLLWGFLCKRSGMAKN